MMSRGMRWEILEQWNLHWEDTFLLQLPTSWRISLEVHSSPMVSDLWLWRKEVKNFQSEAHLQQFHCSCILFDKTLNNFVCNPSPRDMVYPALTAMVVVVNFGNWQLLPSRETGKTITIQLTTSTTKDGASWSEDSCRIIRVTIY